MEALLAWHTLVFYLSIAFGALLAIGAALGGVGDGAHGNGEAADSDGGEGASHGGGAAGDGDAGLSLLALGRLPLVLRLMLLSLIFGGVGLVFGPAVRAVTPGPPALGGLLAIGMAAAGALVLSGGAARLLARRVPFLESETVRRAELVGVTGRLVLAVSQRGGVAQVRDRRGNLHQVGCRLHAGEATLPAGAEVLLVDYDPVTNLFLVANSPIADLRVGT